MKRLTALLLIVLSLVVLLTSCGGGSTTPEDGGNDSPTPAPDSTPASQGKLRPSSSGREENVLYDVATSIPTTFDPEHFGLQAEDGIINNVYETLFRRKNNGDIVLFLAEELTENEDGSVSITLRDAKFHSGDTLKAEDVVYTFSRLETSTICSAIYGLVQVEVEDDNHIKLLFPYADQGAGFNDLLDYLEYIRIENKSWAEEQIADPNDTIGLVEDGTGAYYFESLSAGGDVVLRRFEDYWGEASLDAIKIKYLTGDTDIAFEAGDIDYCGYTAAKLDQAKAYDNVKIEEVSGTSTTFFIIGCNEALPTSDLRVRQAIAYALNRKDVADAVRETDGEPAYNLAHENVEYYTDDVEKFERDLEKSKELLTQAGYSESNRCPIELITLGGNTAWISACELAKANLEESYFTVEISQQDSTARYFQADYEMGIINFSYFNNFAAWFVLFQEDSGIDLAGYDGTGGILDTFAAITDEATTQQAMREAVETLAYYPLDYPKGYYAGDEHLNLGPDFGEMVTLYKDLSWD